MPPVRARLNLGVHGLCALVAVLLVASPAGAAKIMSWNTLNYPGTTGLARADAFRTVIGAIDPDIIVMQEIRDSAGADAMKANVLDVLAPGQWTMATFTNGNDSDNALFFRSGQWVQLDVGEVNTFPRETDWWRLRSVTNANDPGIVIYSTHLKASTGADNVEERRIAARAIRDDMILRWGGGNQPVLVMGDFNMYTSAESGYGALTGNPGELQQMFDPIDSPGSWSANPAFASIHTQSTRITQLSDGGATGGMDDRFDFILVDSDLLDTEAWDFLPGTYQAFGQDGQHFNTAVNALPTNTVGQAVADALHQASDHLPIVLELQRPAQLQIAPISYSLGATLVGTSLQDQLQVRNQAFAPVDELDYTVTSTEVGTSVSGDVAGELEAGQIGNVTFTVDTSTSRILSGGLQVVSDDPGAPQVDVPFFGTVVEPSVPTLSTESVVQETTVEVLDVQTDTVDLTFTVANLDDDVLQADVYVSGTTLGGTDPFRFQLQDPATYFVRTAPVERRVTAFLAGLDPGATIEATVTLTTQDDFTVNGAQPRSPLVVNLRVQKAGATDAPSLVARTTLHAPVPSPFNPRTEIRFDLARSGPVTLEVYDLRGRRVRTLVDGELTAGRHAEVFDGTDATGAQLASGVYLVSLRADGVHEVRRAVLVR